MKSEPAINETLPFPVLLNYGGAKKFIAEMDAGELEKAPLLSVVFLNSNLPTVKQIKIIGWLVFVCDEGQSFFNIQPACKQKEERA